MSYLLGPKRAWRTDLPTYAGVVYDGVYPGIDLVISARQHGLQYGFVVEPGADPATIRVRWQGAKRIRVDEGGRSLGIDTGLGTLREAGLRCFQPDDGSGERDIPCSYAPAGADGVVFAVGQVDRSRPLVIDPLIGWSSYLGGASYDRGHGIALGGSGSIYLAGLVQSIDFPTLGGFDTTFDNGDAFVTKMNSAGGLVWSSYLGGSGGDEADAIAVDASGNVFLTGVTSSSDFPTTGGFATTIGSGYDAFVTKVNSAGTSLAWSSYLGGSAYDSGSGIAVDASGSVYVVGGTSSPDFPTTMGAFDTTLASGDVFVTKVNPAGSSLAWSSYLGGSNIETVAGMAVDGSGNVYVAGVTHSTDFPVTPGAFETTRGGNADAFVTKVDAAGSSLVWSSYLGGASDEYVGGLALDPGGNVYVSGSTFSPDFPTVGGFDTTINGTNTLDAFVAKVNSGGSSLAWSSYLGGSGSDEAHGIALDGSGNVYLTGETYSADFPTLRGFDTGLGTPPDAFVTKVNSAGSRLSWSSYLGGSSDDHGEAVAIDDAGTLYVIGYTTSPDFPTAGGFDTSYGAFWDAFVTRVNQLPNGAACGLPADCAGGFCVDGRCCETSCGGGATTDCQACSISAGAVSDGVCGPVTATTPCRAAGGPCDVAETCDGTGIACPVDALRPATAICRPSTGACDAEEKCSGVDAGCPIDLPSSTGTTCDDGDLCSLADSCQSRVCLPGSYVTCSAADECHAPGTCAPSSGQCSNPAKPDGVRCSNGTCISGVCRPANAGGDGGAAGGGSGGGGSQPCGCTSSQGLGPFLTLLGLLGSNLRRRRAASRPQGFTS